MKIIPLAVAFIFLLSLLPLALADDTGSVKVIDKDGNDVTPDNHEEGDSDDDNKNGGSDNDNQGSESIEDQDYFRNEVSAGNKLFVESLISGLYADIKGNPANEEGEQGGVLFSVITFVPNPYDDKTIVEWYGGYLNLTIYAIVLFVLGELISRSIARTKLASGKLKHKDLSGYRFAGGIAICVFALISNLFYMLALDIIEALNEFITLPIIPNLAVNPENLIVLCFMGLCDAALVLFFVVRYFVIYAFAVACSIVAFLLVPEETRDFAINCIEKMIRLLLLQPAALFFTAIGIVSIDSMPPDTQALWYIGLTVLVFFVCWYFMFGNFKIIKNAVIYTVRKGVVKV